MYIPQTPEHEEALEKDGDEPGRSSSTKDSSSSDESVVSSDSEDQDTIEQNSKEVGDGDNEEQADANDSAGEEHDSSDLRAALRKEIKEFDNKTKALRELANEFDRAASQKRVTLAQLEIKAAWKILTKDN